MNKFSSRVGTVRALSLLAVIASSAWTLAGNAAVDPLSSQAKDIETKFVDAIQSRLNCVKPEHQPYCQALAAFRTGKVPADPNNKTAYLGRSLLRKFKDVEANTATVRIDQFEQEVGAITLCPKHQIAISTIDADTPQDMRDLHVYMDTLAEGKSIPIETTFYKFFKDQKADSNIFACDTRSKTLGNSIYLDDYLPADSIYMGTYVRESGGQLIVIQVVDDYNRIKDFSFTIGTYNKLPLMTSQPK